MSASAGQPRRDAAAGRRPGDWRARVVIAGAVLLGHAALLLGLVAAFAPGRVRAVVAAAMAAVTVTLPPPAPPSPYRPPPRVAREPAGGVRAVRAAAPPAAAAPVVAPTPAIVLTPPVAAAPVAGAGAATAARGGAGTGSSGGGAGGGAGSGVGNGDAARASDPVKIGGGIDLERDYDPAGRPLRRGDYVVIVLSVGADGVPTACRVDRPSRDAAANATTCRLALARFRFRPAADAQGAAVAGTYGWKQVWRH